MIYHFYENFFYFLGFCFKAFNNEKKKNKKVKIKIKEYRK